MYSRGLVAFLFSLFQPFFKNTEFVAFLEFFDYLGNWAVSTQIKKKLFQIFLIWLQVNQSSQHFRWEFWAYLEYIEIYQFRLVVIIQILNKLLHKIVHITENDQGF